MKKYRIAVVCSDTTTVSVTREAATRKNADNFCDGICFALEQQGKSIFLATVKITNY
jgi:hypothetical protein